MKDLELLVLGEETYKKYRLTEKGKKTVDDIATILVSLGMLTVIVNVVPELAKGLEKIKKEKAEKQP